jgi:hypothetical protein
MKLALQCERTVNICSAVGLAKSTVCAVRDKAEKRNKNSE